jgi:hypothetical protein
VGTMDVNDIHIALESIASNYCLMQKLDLKNFLKSKTSILIFLKLTACLG